VAGAWPEREVPAPQRPFGESSAENRAALGRAPGPLAACPHAAAPCPALPRWQIPWGASSRCGFGLTAVSQGLAL